MKKLLIAMMSVASLAFISKAEAINSGTTFENYTGAFGADKDDGGGNNGTFWYTAGSQSECGTLTNIDYTASYNGEHGRPAIAQGAATVTALAVEAEQRLERGIANYGGLTDDGKPIFAPQDIGSGIYFDTMVQFTATDIAPKPDTGDKLIVWLYGLFSDTKGNYVEKTMPDCNGIELCEEWLYHMGVPEERIPEMAAAATTIPAHMPYITSYFMPRALGDRPKVVPDHSKNLAFIGNFAETPRDTVFTTEYSVRTAMEAVYTLLNVDRGVSEVFDSIYDIRQLLRAMYYMSDKKKLVDQDMPLPEKLAVKTGMKKIKRTWVEELLKEANLI